MALQPALRFGSTRRGHRVPTTIDLPAESANDSADARQQAWNQAALQRPGQFLGDTNSEEPARNALATALGYKPGEPTPGFPVLMAKFQSLPASVKAGIYKSGGAQFVSPTKGAELISDQADVLEKVHDTHTNDVVSAITAGKIAYDKGADGTPNWYVMQEQDIDPNNPILGKKQVKVPANDVVKGYIQRAQAKGFIPDLTTGKFPESAPLVPSKQDIQRRMSSEDFQRVLDQRATEADPTVANTAATLASAKNVDVSGMGADANSNMSLTPYKYGSNMQVGDPYAYGNPLQFKETPGEMQGPPAPVPRQGYIASGQAQSDLGVNSEAAGSALVNTLTGIGDLPARGYNWLNQKSADVNQFLFGGERQLPAENLPVVGGNAPLNSNDAALVAAKVAAAQKAADDEKWFQDRRASMVPAY